jgi:hypothetical protein
MRAPPKKKKHHYVPRFVLRNFSPNGGTVPIFVLETGDLHVDASVGDQCAKNYLYGREPDIENAFADSEANVAAILRLAASGDLNTFSGAYRSRVFPDSTAEHDALRVHPLYAIREYVYFQAHRTRASAESIEDMLDAQIKRWLRKEPRFKEQCPEAYEFLDDVSITPNDTMGHILYSAGPFCFAMLDMTVRFFVLEKPGFILCDHPVVLRNQYAEQSPSGPGAFSMLARGLQMFMPVSPTMTIAVYDGDIYECGTDDDVIIKLSSRNAQVLNAMQVRNANSCIYLHPEVAVDHDELRRVWQNRPDTRPRTIEGPIKELPDGTFNQIEYTLRPEIEPIPRLRCFRIRDRTTEEVRRKFGELTFFPIRSRALATAVEDLAALIDWEVKESVIARGLPVDPEWQKWLNEIEDPRP